MIFVSERNGRWVTFRGEKANVTRAFALKFRSTARLSPRPLNLRGNISEIISQPIGPKDSCKINHNGDVRYKRPALAARNFMRAHATFKPDINVAEYKFSKTSVNYLFTW